MGLRFLHLVDLPEHAGDGGFDHAAVSQDDNRLYVAHTANDSLDVIDCHTDAFLHSIPGLKGVAGALVSDRYVFTSNRGEDTVGMFVSGKEEPLLRIPVGIRPNGLSFDPERRLLLAANVGDQGTSRPPTLSIVDIERRAMISSIASPGRTRWTMFDPIRKVFYVNIMDPAVILVVRAEDVIRVSQELRVPAAGPHGLDLDVTGNRLFCACDAKMLVVLEIPGGKILSLCALSGTPDVIFFNAQLRHLYVAVGDPGVIDVIDTHRVQLLETVPTEKGAHTIGFDASRNKVFAFLPESHRAAVFMDS